MFRSDRRLPGIELKVFLALLREHRSNRPPYRDCSAVWTQAITGFDILDVAFSIFTASLATPVATSFNAFLQPLRIVGLVGDGCRITGR